MKYLIFICVLAIFIWVAVVPPEGMSKYPAVNVKFEYSILNGGSPMSAQAENAVQENGNGLD